MPISVSCSCGKTLSVKDELAGKRGKCPACGALLSIPQPAKPAPQLVKPTAVAKPMAAAANKPAPAKKNLGGAAPATLELPDLVGGEDFHQGSLLDEVSANDYKIAGVPTTSNTGHIFAGTPVPAPTERPPGGYPGELLCPFCNKDLDTLTAEERQPHVALGVLTGWWITLPPFKCRNCGPIEYKQLIGESKKTVKKKAAESDRRIFMFIFWVVLILGILVAIPTYIMPWWRSWREEAKWAEFDRQHEQFRRESEERNAKSQKEHEERFGMPGMNSPYPSGSYPVGPSKSPPNNWQAQPTTSSDTSGPTLVQPVKPRPIDPRSEAIRKQQEESRREFEERVRQQREKNKQPTPSRPSPRPSNPNTPANPPVNSFDTSSPVKPAENSFQLPD